MSITYRNDVVPGLITAAQLASSLAAQIERALIPRSVPVSNEIAVFNISSGLSGCSDDQSLFLLLNNIKMNPAKVQHKIERCDE